jgi:hypothetical protein
MKSFIFLLDSQFLVTATEECLALAEITLEEGKREGFEVPEKFEMCRRAASKMLTMESVNKDELQGLFDVVGGYYCATIEYCKRFGDEDDRVSHANELMRFVRKLNDLVRPVWGLDLLQGGKV